MGTFCVVAGLVIMFSAFSGRTTAGPDGLSLAVGWLTFILGLLLYKAAEIEQRLHELVQLAKGCEPTEGVNIWRSGGNWAAWPPARSRPQLRRPPRRLPAVLRRLRGIS
jgi:hypothetical protein